MLHILTHCILYYCPCVLVKVYYVTHMHECMQVPCVSFVISFPMLPVHIYYRAHLLPFITYTPHIIIRRICFDDLPRLLHA